MKGQRSPDRFVFTPSENAGRGGIPHLHRPLGVQEDDRDRGAVYDRAELTLAIRQPNLRGALRADVRRDAHQPGDLALRSAHRCAFYVEAEPVRVTSTCDGLTGEYARNHRRSVELGSVRERELHPAVEIERVVPDPILRNDPGSFGRASLGEDEAALPIEAEDHHRRVADHGGEPLREVAPFGHVAQHREVPAGDDVRGGAILDYPPLAVCPHQRDLAAVAPSGANVGPYAGHVDLAGGERGELFSDDGLARDTQQFGRGRVGVDVAAVVVDNYHRVEGFVEHDAQHLLALIRSGRSSRRRRRSAHRRRLLTQRRFISAALGLSHQRVLSPDSCSARHRPPTRGERSRPGPAILPGPRGSPAPWCLSERLSWFVLWQLWGEQEPRGQRPLEHRLDCKCVDELFARVESVPIASRRRAGQCSRSVRRGGPRADPRLVLPSETNRLPHRSEYGRSRRTL